MIFRDECHIRVIKCSILSISILLVILFFLHWYLVRFTPLRSYEYSYDVCFQHCTVRVDLDEDRFAEVSRLKGLLTTRISNILYRESDLSVKPIPGILSITGEWIDSGRNLIRIYIKTSVEKSPAELLKAGDQVLASIETDEEISDWLAKRLISLRERRGEYINLLKKYPPRSEMNMELGAHISKYDELLKRGKLFELRSSNISRLQVVSKGVVLGVASSLLLGAIIFVIFFASIALVSKNAPNE